MTRIIGISLAVGVCTGVAMGLLLAHTNLYISIGVAVIAIVVGSTIARIRPKANCESSITTNK